ncbi:hypothetical protein SDC9_173875 [bioreactor metagenome]|uniref:Collagen-like protein n=1 Tax=bioreactor metagenome TaxID=1076179 RepID=A0A645GJX6_9ZZZZ
MGPQGIQGHPGVEGPEGPEGPQGPAGVCSGCICEQQMYYVLNQIITKYPNRVIIINMEDGGSEEGIPTGFYPTPSSTVNPGLLILDSGVVNLCKIASFKITGVVYDTSIEYLPVPTEPEEGCGFDCEAAIRNYLTVGENVQISAGGQTVSNGPILRKEYGMIVSADNANVNPIFTSTCNIEVID